MHKNDFSKKKSLSAIAVGFGTTSESVSEIKSNLAELEELIYSLGWTVQASTFQRAQQIKSGTLIGQGKVDELKKIIEETKAEAVVFDHQLSGGQLRNLSKELGVVIADRNQIIIDIFAKRAQTKEGKLQVELARLLDELPRMIGGWHGSLSRLGGGIGTRGPGESALETDRRTIRERIAILKRKLEDVKKHRKENIKNRSKALRLALVGYTNAGKSSLLKSLSGSDTYIEDQLFATLDPLTKKIFIKDLGEVIITDTVGFINKIPTHLIEAFKSTLEEARSADVLLHVIDSSDTGHATKANFVNELLDSFNWDKKPRLNVYNKIDLLKENEKRSFPRDSPFVLVSTKTQEGLPRLKSLISNFSSPNLIKKEIFIPNNKLFELEPLLTQSTNVQKVEKSSLGKVFYVSMQEKLIPKWSKYID